MDQLSPTDLMCILHSKRANLYYLEHCRVMQKDGRVLYLTEEKSENSCGSLPGLLRTTAVARFRFATPKFCSISFR
ncbi:MAG: hypothetical protein JW863_02500, partial [Chitinispirillaceae bacterium]|nr:hypothetical protein [Chitinispirillaceae bacterium]